jgi:hypothetical protein
LFADVHNSIMVRALFDGSFSHVSRFPSCDRSIW